MSGETITIADLLLGIDVVDTPDTLIDRAVESIQSRVARQKVTLAIELETPKAPKLAAGNLSEEFRRQMDEERRAHQEGKQRLRDQAATMQLNARLAAQAAAEEKRRNREGINGIENEVKAWRNLWQSRVVGNDQVYAQQARLRQQALEMALTVDKQSDAYKRLTAVAAAAQRTMDSSQGKNTPGGFSFGVSQGITNALGQFGVTGDLIGGFVQLIAAKRAAARNEAADLGRDTMAGLAGGLRTGTVPVAQAADAAADSVSEAIRRSLDIHSPSRVTEYLGRMTSLGFIQGIKSLQAEARAAAAGLASAAEAGMAGRGVNSAQTAQQVTARSGGGIGGSSNAAEAAAALAALNAQLAANAAAAQAVEATEEAASGALDGLGESVAGATENVRGLVDARREEDEESRNVAMNEAKTALAYAATAAALTGVAVAVSASINAAADYEQAMSKAGATTQATAGEMRDLDAVAKSAPLVKMGVDATEAAAGIEELGSAGLSTAQIIDGGLQSSLALAGAVSTDIGTAASVSAASVKAFGLEAKDLAHVADVVTNAVNGTSVKMENFADAIAAGGSTAQQTGLDFTTFTAAISFMTDKAIGASDAGTSLKTFLMALTPNSKDAAKAMKELGFSAFDTEGNFKPLGQVVEELRLAFSKLTPEQRASKAEMIFGADGIRAFNILVEQGAAGLKERTDQLNEMGTADKAQADKLESLRGKQEQFNAALTNFKIVVGESFLPGMTDATEAAAKFLQVLMDINREQGNLNQGLAAYGAETYDLPTWLKNSGLKESDLRPAEVRQVKDLLARMQREASQGAADAQAWRNVGAEGSAVRREAETARAIGKLGQQLGELQRVISVRTSGQNPLAPPTSPEAVLATFMKAIAKVESQGTGNYQAFNTTWDPRTTAGQGAVGRYQFMPFNLIEDSSYRLPQSQRGAYARANMDNRGRAGFGWDFEATGRDYTIREILNDPQVQDKIAQYKIKQWFEQELKKTNNDVEQAIKNTAGRWNGSGADGNYARQVLNHYRDMTAPVTTLSGEGPLLPGQVRTSPGAESFRAAAATQALMATGVRTADEVVNYCAQWVRVTLGKADKRVEGLVNSMFQKDRNGDGDMDAQDAAAGVKAAGLFRDFRSVADLKPGDTVFYTDGGQNHAGIYLGDGMVRGNNRVTYQENGGRFGPGGITSGVALDAGKVNPVGTVAMTRLGRVTGYMSATELAVRAGVMTGEPLIPGPKPKDDQKLIAEARRILTALSNAEKSGNLTAKVAAQGVLDAFTKSGPRAAAAVEYVQSQVKAASKEVGKFGQGYDKLKGQLEQAGSLFKINDDTQAYIKSLDAVTSGAQAAAAAERKRNGETEKYRALLALAGDAAGKARQERAALQSDQDRADQEAATRNRNRLQTQQNLQKALAEGRVADARAALDNLKRSQADELALAKDNAVKRAQIIKNTGSAIIAAEAKLAAILRNQSIAAAKEAADKALEQPGADKNAVEATRRAAVRLAYQQEARTMADARAAQASAQRGANQARLDEEKRLSEQLSSLQIERAEATAARLKTIHDAEIKAAEGNLSKQQALIAKYAEQEYQTALKLADMKRDQRVAAAKGPNASAEVQAANAAYDATAAAALVTRDQAISGAAKATTASVRALRDEYGRLAESIREKVKAGQFDEAAQLAAARSFNELGRKARAAGLDQNTFIEGARKSAWATLQAGKGAEGYRQTLLDLDAEMEASAAGQKAAADAAVTLSNSLEGLGDREGAMQVLNDALDQVMEAAGRGEVVGEAISILTGQIDRLNATLDQGALERAATYLHHIREDAEAAAEATLTASEANLTEKEFADRDRVRALARTGPEALLNFLGGPDNEFFGDQFWTQLGEFGRGEFLAAFERITPDQLGRLGPDFLKAFRDQIDPDDPTFAGIRARVDEGLTRAYRQVGDADVQTDLNRILREAQDLQAGFTNWDDPVALMEYRDRLRELAAELGLLKVAAADGQWAQDVEGAFASVTASADEAQQSLTELLDVLSAGTPDEVVAAANAIGESAMTALNKAALDYQLGVIDGEAYNKVLEEQAALLAPVLAKLEAMGPEYANVAAGIRLVIQATKDMKAEGDPNPGPDATPTGADTLAADTIGNLLRPREGVKDGSISVAQFRTEVAGALPDVEALAAQFERAGRTDLAKTLRGAAGEMRALGGWTVKALEGLTKFTTYADYFKQIAGSFGKLTAALGEGEEDYDRLTGKKLQTPWKDLSANIDGAVNLASKLMDMATDVMKIVANPADIGAWVSLITKVVSSIADAIAGFQKAKAEVARLKAEFAEDNPLLNPADYQKTFTRSRGWLADIFGGGPEVVNEIDKLGMIFARSMQDGLMNGIKNGLKEAIKQNDMSLFGKYLREGVGDAILTGIVDSFIQGELMKNTLAPAIKAWSDAMKTTDDTNDDIAALAGIDTAVTTAIGLAERFGKDVVPRLSTLRDKGYFGDPSDPGSSGGGSAFGNAPGVQYGLPRVEVTFPPEFIQAASDIRTGGSDLRLGAAEFRLGVAEFREALRTRGGAPALSAQGGLA